MNVLFDLDGTLTDPKLGFVRSIHYALSELSIKFDPDTNFESYIGPPAHDTFRELCGNQGLAEEAISLYRERYAEIGLFENEPYEGIQESLERILGSAKSIHVATSKPTVFSRRIIEHFGLDRYFNVVYGSNLDGSLSDKTELLNHILEEQGFEPSDAVMIGDRRYDMIGANNHGIRAIGVLWGYGSEEELRNTGADEICSHPEELYEQIFK
ncbi:MAG: HAD hydrolase-like protein [Gammaproteobacteria bacterium]|nr:HAD hydrolase-like protein [Gammaproteobacteria bacterium]